MDTKRQKELPRMMNEQLPITEANPIKARYYDYAHFTYPWHFHAQYELIYIKESTGQCFVGDSITPYAAGDLVFVGANLPHFMRSDDRYIRHETNGRVQGTIIQFEQHFMRYSFSHYPQFIQIKRLLEEASRGILFRAQASSPIGRLMAGFPRLEGIAQVTAMLELLQAMALSPDKQLLATPHYYETFPTMGDRRIEKVLSYINGHYTRRLTLAEIAEKANMNYAAFSRYFRNRTGKTFVQYMTDMRIGYACKLLLLGSMDVAQIAIECGFESLSNFNKMFRQLQQMTPTQYREQALHIR